ncbi:hypothetical protein ACVGXO_03800 [Enterobacter hormaechei]|uniref:hypothetical protein n=1 Tax=Enterobacteriaceae TaxID=543 RepID=UPI00115C5AD0|nr:MULTISPECIES: hypothetical protein [Citrobacter freundii complex]TRL71728.1 hypothetical protein FMM65_10145 [Citrobacter youngae]KAA0560592.1 hypothetical protein F0326_23860 [Citrobacter portucalensis]MBA8563935.1 hypothetical protein [Citrobacter freundii]MDH1298392.1 hypothetical protein [Citrobacter freundii]MDT7352647.1 hypothetical protein [Citrobacter freundii]
MKKGKTSGSGLLASDSDWHNNACLNYMPDHGTAYTEGYRRAADILIKHIDESRLDQDFLVYPVLFLYRHHIELLIKQIIGLALALAEDPDKYQYKKDDHNLNTLWPLAQKLLLEVDDCYRSSDFRLIKEVVKELHKADRRATDFRYARRNDGTRSLEGIHYINTRRFGEKMGAASDSLDAIDSGLRYLLEQRSEWNSILNGF